MAVKIYLNFLIVNSFFMNTNKDYHNVPTTKLLSGQWYPK
ncbi:hypothetical protein LMANV2_410017 [Leptospira interrogans serovar Manilae]|uniref:Uncharacterized protein n=1 Tax=Leptospira interrogans serovar Manilae TaxID=214675 RepID=A0AAQ1NZD9_LEPIR|nr:hypothetical protein LMANV2_410017 [Leptospira interrogans serovar Manilae]